MRDREPRGCPPAARLGHRAASLSHRRHHGLGSRRFIDLASIFLRIILSRIISPSRLCSVLLTRFNRSFS